MTPPLLRVVCALLSLVSLTFTCASAEGSTSPRPYEPAQAVTGTIRVWSNAAMKGLVTRWGEGFRKHHPGASIVATTIGSDVAMAGLYTGLADIALMGREPTASEVQAFEWVYRVKPTRVEIMSGGLDAPERSPALVVFVQRDNPLSKLTLAQLDAIFGYEHLRGPKSIRTWGQLGLGGEWAARPIDLYGPDATSGTGAFFRHVVLGDSRNMNWDRMREFSDQQKPDGTVIAAGARTLDALARDRFGIAVAQLGFGRPQLKSLALANDDAGPFVEATAASVASRQYPLARTAFAVFKRLPDRPVEPAVTEFLRYVLSEEGQTEIVRERSYLRLPTDIIQKQLVTVTAPASPRIPTKIYAQQLVDETAAKNPELLVIAFHATPPKGSDDVIVASNIGRIGKKTLELADDGSRFHVGLALKDTSGVNIGALDLAFPYKAGSDRAALQQKAERIRDGLSRQILNEANLFDPYPLDPTATTKAHAQRLVDQAMAKHPEVLSLAMHVTLPNSSENIILGSSFGRIGKKADEDDMKVIESGKTTPGIYAGGRRFGVELALQDARGKTIGALSVAYAYKPGDDQAALLDRAEKLRDDLRKQFDWVEQLVALDP